MASNKIVPELTEKAEEFKISVECHLLPPIQQKKNLPKRITLNARGIKYEILFSNLEKAAATSRLGRLKTFLENDAYSKESFVHESILSGLCEICDDFDLKKNEFYFDRDPFILNLVLNGLVNRRYHLLDNKICVNLFTSELNYWNVKRSDIESCCLVEIDNKQEASEKELEHEQAIIDEINENVDFGNYCFPRTREKLWFMLENPTESVWGIINMIIYFLIIVLSTLEIILRSMPGLQTNESAVAFFNAAEIICIIWFTLQFLLRLVICPNKLKFFSSIMNIIDLLSVVPYFIYLMSQQTNILFRIKNITRVLRVLTIFKAIGHTRAKTLSDTLKYSYREIGVYLIYLSVGILIFSSIVYYCEHDTEKSLFTSIPATFWWSIITMTTVGYGDMVPLTIVGKIIGGICALSGIIIIAMPVGLVSNNFSIMYEASEKKKVLIARLNKKSGEKITIQSQEDEI